MICLQDSIFKCTVLSKYSFTIKARDSSRPLAVVDEWDDTLGGVVVEGGDLLGRGEVGGDGAVGVGNQASGAGHDRGHSWDHTAVHGWVDGRVDTMVGTGVDNTA